MTKIKTSKDIFSSNVRRIMNEQGIVQEDVSTRAKRSGHKIDQKTVSRSINEGNPTIKTIEAIACGLGVSPWELLIPENVSLFPKMNKAGELLDVLTELNEDGVKTALKHAQFLASDPQFQASPKVKQK